MLRVLRIGVVCAGYEPHSALPTAMPMVFCEHSPMVPPALKTMRVLATSAVRTFLPPQPAHLLQGTR